jgi:copper chaperone
MEFLSTIRGFRTAPEQHNCIMKTEIHVTGMRCSGCELLVTEALEEMEGVEKVHASHADGTIVVEFDESKVDPGSIKAVIEGQGFSVTA